MDTVWIRTQDNVLVRADSIVLLRSSDDGLHAEFVTGRTVQLTQDTCSEAFQLSLIEEIRHAGVDDRRSVVIMPVLKGDSLVWHRECADTLVDLANDHDKKANRLVITKR